jgi:hypothetical protein
MKGLIVCNSNQKKRYNGQLKLTDIGLIVAESISSKIDKILDYASIDVSDNDRETMYKSLISISDRLEKLCEKYEGEE